MLAVASGAGASARADVHVLLRQDEDERVAGGAKKKGGESQEAAARAPGGDTGGVAGPHDGRLRAFVHGQVGCMGAWVMVHGAWVHGQVGRMGTCSTLCVTPVTTGTPVHSYATCHIPQAASRHATAPQVLASELLRRRGELTRQGAASPADWDAAAAAAQRGAEAWMGAGPGGRYGALLEALRTEGWRAERTALPRPAWTWAAGAGGGGGAGRKEH